jgi:hypothetical protein
LKTLNPKRNAYPTFLKTLIAGYQCLKIPFGNTIRYKDNKHIGIWWLRTLPAMKNVKMLAIMHMHNWMNLDNRTTLVLNNAGQVFNYLLIPTSSGYLNKFRVSQRIVGSGYLKNFRTKEP